jgi:peptidoglycan DL-endopeptidase CwlO
MSTAIKSKIFSKKLFASVVLIAAAVLVAFGSLPPAKVSADVFDEQIKALEGEISAYQAEAGRLRAEADTLQNAINVLNAQKRAIQAQIDLNQAKYDSLVKQIEETQKKLEDIQAVLGDALAKLYVESSITPVEMLASSQSIGDYLDKQEYQNAIRDQLQRLVQESKALKLQLVEQKKEVERILADQKSQREQLAAQEAEQARILAVTQGQESAYQSMIGDRNSKIGDLRAQQLAANQKLGGSVTAGDPGHGGYPSVWDNAPQDSIVDNWGMYNRECVSYTAWKVYASGRYMPYWGGRGNANQWPSSAQADGIQTGGTPRVGSVAISMSGFYGHAMWVEQVYGNGYIRVSQYNYDLAGHYSEMTLNGAGLVYIYF